jgi:hypothetical protein
MRLYNRKEAGAAVTYCVAAVASQNKSNIMLSRRGGPSRPLAQLIIPHPFGFVDTSERMEGVCICTVYSILPQVTGHLRPQNDYV